MKNILITGANRGIGLGLTATYLQRGERVFATHRSTSSIDDLNQLKSQHADRLHLLKVEVTDEESVRASVDVLKQHTESLDLLINNAAILFEEAGFDDMTAGHLRDTFEVNVIAPMTVIKHYLPFIKRGSNPIIVNISSSGGSISTRKITRNPSYASSKAALNMLTRLFAKEHREQGIIAIPLHPGWVRTDMGGDSASLSIDESVAGMVNVIDNLTLDDTGRFLQWDGQELGW